MRAKKLPTIASNVNFSAGTRLGFPNKIAPPSLNFTDGKLPRGKFAAEWQNYIENGLQAQVEVSAAAPFQNWRQVNGTIPDFHSSPPAGAAYNPVAGATLFTTSVTTNTVYEVIPIGFVVKTRTLVPASGLFSGADTCYDPINKCWWVAGSNSVTATKSLWRLTATGQVETTAPTSGNITRITVDAATGIPYAFVNDANNSVIWFVSGAWAVHSTRGSSAGNAVSVAAFNGELFVATSYTGARHDYYTAGSWHTRTDIGTGADTMIAVYYSRQYSSWFVSNDTTGFYVLGTVSGLAANTPWPGSGNSASSGSCLHEMGYVNPGNTGSTAIYVQIAQEMQPLAAAFDNAQAPASWTRFTTYYDGSAIWTLLQTSGTNALYATSRSDAHLS